MKMNKSIYIENIEQEEIFNFIQKSLKTTNKYFNLNQLNKFFIDRNKKWNNIYIWRVLKVDNQIKALCILLQKKPENILYINGFHSFEKGYGRILLNDILNQNNYDLIYLQSYSKIDQQKLNNYYKSFNLIEREIGTTYYFYKNYCLSKEQLNNFITKRMI